MPWWLVWVLLVLAALALLVWIGLRLYRAFRALMVELEQAQQVLDRLDARLAELEELAQQAGEIAPEIVLTPERRNELAATRQHVREIRRSRKLLRHERATASWDTITGTGRRQP